MRIVDVCAFYTPSGGGVKTYIDNKMRAAPSSGHELIVLAPGEQDSVVAMDNGSLLHTLAAPTMPLDRRYHYFDDEPALHRALDQWRPDHVEVSSPWSSATMVGRWQGPATRSLVMHSDPLSAYAYRWFEAIAAPAQVDRWFVWFWRHLRGLDRMFDVVVSASEGLSKRLVDNGLHKVRTVPMGVEPGIFSPALRDLALRARWLDQLGLSEDGTLLLSVGRFAAEKRWPMVLRAAGRAGTAAPIGLALIGAGQHEPRLKRLAHRFPHVAVAPPITDRSAMARLMASADALVHGCESETFCMVASEARASGLPLIVPDRGGAADQLRPGDVGEHYASGDRAALIDAIGRFEMKRGKPGAAPGHLRSRPVRTMDQHFAELFGLYLLGLPLLDYLSDLVN
ncbi:MAG: glycosyltransferase [Pseudomonadota bacterium]|nr:glycosyltransferase [Pseudomonadota bacterium]